MRCRNTKRFIWILILATCSFASNNGDQNMIEKTKAIHEKVLTIDTHCDTPLHMTDATWDVGVRHVPGKRGSGKIDLPRMKEGGLDVEFFAVFVGQAERTENNYQRAKNRADELITLVKGMCRRYTQTVALATSPDQAYHNEKKGLISIYLGLENGFPIGKDLKNVQRYYDMGVRYITLCHVKNNDICDSSTDAAGPEHHGLSDFGRQVVKEMNWLGMIIDVSHISDKAFYDVLEVSEAPVIASHSCVRALCDTPRNLSDDMLKALAAKKGVIQICLVNEYLKKIKPDPEKEQALKMLQEKYGSWENVKDPEIRKRYRNEYYAIENKYPQEKATVQDVIDHIDHVVKLVGIDYVGIGTDFDGGGGVTGCDDVSEMPNITIELVKRGYSEEDIRKIWGGNFMRVFRKVLEIAYD